MSGPWEQYAAAPTAPMPWEQFAAPPAPAPSFIDQMGRQAGLAGRAVIQGVAGLPAMAADVGVAGRNLVENLRHGITPTLADFNPFAKTGGTPQTYELPSQSFNQALTSVGMPAPKTTTEKLTGLVESGLTGSRMPAPQAAEQAPTNFVSPKDMPGQITADTIRRGQNAGYVVPPATGNRSLGNMTLETIAGKTSVQQHASVANQAATNNLAKTAVGLNPDAPLTAEGLAAIRAEASQAGYEPIRAAGSITAPASFHDQLVAALSKYTGAERSFPGMGKTELSDIVGKIDQPQFDAGDAIDLTKILRDKASAAFRAGDSGAGSGLRDISKAVENAIDKGLQDKGPQYADAVSAFRNARQTIAKTYTVENAFNPGTGNVVAAKLAAALKKGEPLSGDLKDAAKFAAAFPRAVAEPVHSMGINHLDMYAPMLSAMLGEGPGQKAIGLAVPVSRWAARQYLLSPMGQAGAIRGISTPNTGSVPMGMIGARQSAQ